MEKKGIIWFAQILISFEVTDHGSTKDLQVDKLWIGTQDATHLLMRGRYRQQIKISIMKQLTAA